MNSQKFFSIRYKFTIFFLCVVFIPISVISIVYYSLSSKIIQDKFSMSNLVNTKQTGLNIDLILNDIHQLSLNIIRDTTINSFLKKAYSSSYKLDTKSRVALEEWLVYLTSSNEYIDSISIKSKCGISIYAKGTEYPMDAATESQVRSLKGKYLWYTGMKTDYSGSKITVLSLARSLNDINNVGIDIGILGIDISENKISNIYMHNLANPSEQFFLVGDKNQIISSPDKSYLNKPINTSVFKKITGNTKKYGYFTASINNSKVLVTYYKLDNTSWFLVNYVPFSDLLKEIRIVRTQLALSIIISFFSFSVLTILFLGKILRPLKKVRNVMKELQTGNFDIRLDLTGNDEIALLGKSFNQMSNQLKDLMNQVYLVKIHQKEAELNNLQAQINPHFLYNTLDTIYWMARMEKAAETSNLIQALSKLFRLSLNHGQQYTTVENELHHLDSYIIIQQKRYEGTISFNIDVNEETLECEVIKLILQPLVENAIYHGIEPKGESGSINISIYCQDDTLIYEVSDNGVGTDDSEIQKVLAIPHDRKSSYGFALKNVNDRIKLYYGEAYGIIFHSTIGVGTFVTVRQPIKKRGDAHDKIVNCR